MDTVLYQIGDILVAVAIGYAGFAIGKALTGLSKAVKSIKVEK